MNILAWKDVRKKFRITADSENRSEITVHLAKDNKIIFKSQIRAFFTFMI